MSTARLTGQLHCLYGSEHRPVQPTYHHMQMEASWVHASADGYSRHRFDCRKRLATLIRETRFGIQQSTSGHHKLSITIAFMYKPSSSLPMVEKSIVIMQWENSLAQFKSLDSSFNYILAFVLVSTTILFYWRTLVVLGWMTKLDLPG